MLSWHDPGVTTAQILVADDDEAIAASVRRALVYEGYDVFVVHDGSAALRSAVERPFDLFVLDVMMPELDGVEVCRLIRADSDVPILMLTARDALTV